MLLLKWGFLLGRLLGANFQPWILFKKEVEHWRIDIIFVGRKRNLAITYLFIVPKQERFGIFCFLSLGLVGSFPPL